MSKKRAGTADLSALKINRESEQVESTGPASKNKLVVGGTLVLVILVAVIYLLNARMDSIPTVSVATVATIYPSQAEAILTASGYVVAQRQAAIASKGSGRLEVLNVEEGDVVKKGQIIAELEHTDVDAALAQARANLEMARALLTQNQADLHEAELNYQRQKGLTEKGLISDSEFDIAEARYKSALATVASAKAQIAQAEAAVQAAQVDVENTRIRAPFDGTVLTKNADVGEMVAPFAASSNSRGAVVTIADMTSLEVEADVSEANIQRVRVGQACDIILDAFPGHYYPGYVHKIVPTADRSKATVLTKIRFVDRDEKVLPEMSAKVNFFSRTLEESDHTSEPMTAIPKSAIVSKQDLKVVFVLHGDTVTETSVTVGEEVAGQVEVLQGVAVGDRVVLRPAQDLHTGSKVVLEKR
ncbi:MAG: efflux RND transporter periplasmic adaptor subunit [bacterium]